MRGDRWGPEGPPDEAYSRVTEPERFAPLHPAALEALDRLTAEYDVGRVEGYGLDAELESRELARPSIRVVPNDPGAAPILVAFTIFPGLGVRLGRWHTDRYPGCGCDACDETAGIEIARFQRMIDDVTAGRFREAIRLPLVGSARQSFRFWSGNGGSGGEGRIERSRAREMLAGGDRSSYEWAPWPRR